MWRIPFLTMNSWKSLTNDGPLSETTRPLVVKISQRVEIVVCDVRFGTWITSNHFKCASTTTTKNCLSRNGPAWAGTGELQWTWHWWQSLTILSMSPSIPNHFTTPWARLFILHIPCHFLLYWYIILWSPGNKCKSSNGTTQLFLLLSHYQTLCIEPLPTHQAIQCTSKLSSTLCKYVAHMVHLVGHSTWKPGISGASFALSF